MQAEASVAPTPRFTKIQGKNLLQYWESEATRPQIKPTSVEGQQALERFAETELSRCLVHPFGSAAEIRDRQFERIQELVQRASREVPFYAEKYRVAGFDPADLRSWSDFERVPLVTKDELLEAGLAKTVSRRWAADDLFATRTFGTSGKTLLIRVNLDAILIDTLQGVRQFWLQSGLRFRPDHLTAMLYTIPWWFESIGDDFRSAFISGVIPPPSVARILHELQPHVLSCYPTNLKALVELEASFRRDNLYLAVVHSEHSSTQERQAWGQALGVPVRNEYSTEEATRIALELPCGHQHVCEDAVHLEVLHPDTHRPQADGEPGLAVVTNLLNDAMPFIRYVQGDYVTRPASPGRCLIGWSQLANVAGRVNDSFINLDGRATPAGTILDVVYRWMFDAGLQIREFELTQTAPDRIRATFIPEAGASESNVQRSVGHLRDLLAVCLGHSVGVVSDCALSIPRRPGKRRPIRREFSA